MADPSRDELDLDARLSEIDRRLRAIHAELAPRGAQAEPALPPARGRTGPLAEVLQHAPRHTRLPSEPGDTRVEQLAELQNELLGSLREIAASFERALARLPRDAAGELSVSVGPFTSIEALRAFERELESLPSVRRVAVRGYEGVDRAVIDVELA